MNKRLNVFNQAHKAIRGMMYDAALGLQTADFTSAGEAAAVIESVEVVLSVLHGHLKVEEEYILDEIKKTTAPFAASFEKEHERLESQSHRLKSLIVVLNNAVSAQEKEEAGYAIAKAFQECIALHLVHMNRQESELNEHLWNIKTDEEISALINTILTKVPAHLRFIESRWVLKSTSLKEVMEWMTSLRRHAPAFIFESIYGLAEKVLPANYWLQLKIKLNESEIADH